MSDEKKVEPAKKAVTLDEVKKQLDGLSAFVRKLVKRLEELGGIDINMDGKVGMIMLSLMLVSGVVLATDTAITGFPATTGIGTFQVTSDGTDCTLTVNKATITTLVINGTNITGNIGVAQITNALTTAGASIGGNIPVAAVTNALAGTAYTTNTLTGDGVTNVFIWNTVGGVKVLKSITTTP